MKTFVDLDELVIYNDSNYHEFDSICNCHTTQTILRELALYQSIYSSELVEALKTTLLIHCL